MNPKEYLLMKTSKSGMLVCIGLLISLGAFGQATEFNIRFDQGNTAFLKGQYEEAILAYEEILAAGYISSDVYFNLGNAYYQSGEIPAAILSYERALKLEPYHEGSQKNISLARLEVEEEIAPVPAFFLKVWWQNWIYRLPANGWLVLTAVIWWLAGGGLLLWLVGKTREQRKLGFLAGGLLLILSLLPLASALSAGRKAAVLSEIGIVLAPTISLHSAPSEQSPDLRIVYGGSRVRVMEQKGDWCKVQLNSGEEGWVLTESFELI